MSERHFATIWLFLYVSNWVRELRFLVKFDSTFIDVEVSDFNKL